MTSKNQDPFVKERDVIQFDDLRGHHIKQIDGEIKYQILGKKNPHPPPSTQRQEGLAGLIAGRDFKVTAAEIQDKGLPEGRKIQYVTATQLKPDRMVYHDDTLPLRKIFFQIVVEKNPGNKSAPPRRTPYSVNPTVVEPT